MTRVHHLNCGTLHVPPGPRAACHCLLIETDRGEGLALVDTGIGLEDVRRPLERIGTEAIEAAGFQFDEAQTALRQIEAMGLRPEAVRDIVLTHADPDHAGGLADFPWARVHISEEEHRSLTRGEPPARLPRYSQPQFAHGPDWRAHAAENGTTRDWFGLEARELRLSIGAEALLVPLFGHTHGHCGVAVRTQGRWVLHAGDAYYLRAELERDDHPVSALAAARADDDAMRRASLEHLRTLARDHASELEMFGYHDFGEFPAAGPR